MAYASDKEKLRTRTKNDENQTKGVPSSSAALETFATDFDR